MIIFLPVVALFIILFVILARLDTADRKRCEVEGVCTTCRGTGRLSGFATGPARRFTYPCPDCTS